MIENTYSPISNLSTEQLQEVIEQVRDDLRLHQDVSLSKRLDLWLLLQEAKYLNEENQGQKTLFLLKKHSPTFFGSIVGMIFLLSILGPGLPALAPPLISSAYYVVRHLYIKDDFRQRAAFLLRKIEARYPVSVNHYVLASMLAENHDRLIDSSEERLFSPSTPRSSRLVDK